MNGRLDACVDPAGGREVLVRRSSVVLTFLLFVIYKYVLPTARNQDDVSGRDGAQDHRSRSPSATRRQ